METHSGAKLRLIQHYLDSYFDAVVKNPALDTLRITLVDGFCGGGAFDDNGRFVDGTPFLLLNAVQDAQTRLNANKTKTINIDAQFHFVDKDEKAIEYLKDMLLQKGHIARIGKDIFLHSEKFENAVFSISDTIKRRTRNNVGRSLFLLDQKGYTAAPLPTIKSIFDNFNKAECILTFAVDWLIDYLSDRNQNISAITKLGVTPERVRELIAHKGTEGGRYAIQRLLLSDIQSGTGAQFISPFFIRSAQSNKDLWLVHLSRVSRARNVMVDSHWSVANHSIHQGRGGLEIKGFDPEKDNMMDFMFAEHEQMKMIEHLSQDLLLRLSANFGFQPVKYGAFVDAVVNETPARLADIDRSILKLRDEREITIFGPKHQEKRSQQIDKDDLVTVNRQTKFSFS